jgi:hypothetical protein
MDNICSICLEKVNLNFFSFNKYITKCIEKWLSKQNTCPICRDKINNILLKRLTFI